MVEGVAAAFATFISRYGGFFRTETRDCSAVAGRYLRGLAQAAECTLAAMATVVDASGAQQCRHFISNSPCDPKAVVAQISQDADHLPGGQPTSSLIIDESSFATRWCVNRPMVEKYRASLSCCVWTIRAVEKIRAQPVR